MEEIAERYRRRAEAFEQKVAAVRPEQWGDQSPCEKWTARDVVDHIVGMHGYMLIPAGRSLDGATTVQEDPLAAFQAARAAVEAVLDDPALAKQESDTPAGRMTSEAHIDQVISDDLVLHGWDLARATGQDETMDPGDVERLWSSNSSIPPEVIEMYRTPDAFGPGIEVFGPEVVVPADAPLQDRLLGFIGRTP
ncbi:uncharacterized protein (TIGR03086 family) [Kribbella orskensis]|uniref:Uncharacterized protein (TIGR03086 family) n=1 Tax=Kribbella orskensis TaxID=2512216 RepID=A0ABY2BM38_9ACTN|nr:MULTISPECIES: TIGR03086 family metal-binding protein [Kribbella]TCN41158.1 uncharacterized protein (TIGR03086 family) [Kribbella sp. VKM Ac-2500]TCO24410.1 uncharacterized protein (TIGR03086 family) [Kribbella orskensis]